MIAWMVMGAAQSVESVLDWVIWCGGFDAADSFSDWATNLGFHFYAADRKSVV